MGWFSVLMNIHQNRENLFDICTCVQFLSWARYSDSTTLNVDIITLSIIDLTMKSWKASKMILVKATTITMYWLCRMLLDTGMRNVNMVRIITGSSPRADASWWTRTVDIQWCPRCFRLFRSGLLASSSRQSCCDHDCNIQIYFKYLTFIIIWIWIFFSVEINHILTQIDHCDDENMTLLRLVRRCDELLRTVRPGTSLLWK